MSREFKVIRTTTTKIYLVEQPSRPIMDLIKEWFFNPRYPVWGPHAHREGCMLGGFEHVDRVEEISMDEFKAYRDRVSHEDTDAKD